jgi:hypothetical protein
MSEWSEWKTKLSIIEILETQVDQKRPSQNNIYVT